jgi:cytidyltransferase-like protein
MVVYTVGTFDLLHVGHLALLEYCATLGDTVAVGVASDEVVKLYKPNPPVIPLEQRIEMLLALSCVDIVIPYHELDYLSVCKKVKADIFVIGEDWGRKPHNQDVENYFNIKGKKVVQIKYSPKNSSTQIKKDVIAQFQRN